MANTKIRFLVLDAKNNAIRPDQMGLKLGEGVQNGKSPSFLDKGKAEQFAQLLAQSNIGQNYYVAQVTGVASASHDMGAMLADGTSGAAPVKFTPTVAGGEGDDE